MIESENHDLALIDQNFHGTCQGS